MNDTDDPVPHDPWLREALRHAPDADAAPPPKVNEAILRLGRAAVAARVPRPAPPPPNWFDRVGEAWGWLARPPVAAAFAGLMVATVVGVMWWGRPLEEALPPREAPVVASAPPPAIVAAPADVPAPARTEAPAAAKAAAPQPIERKMAPPAAPAKAVPAPPPVPAEANRVAELARQKQSLPAIAAGAAAPATPAPDAAPALPGGLERRELAATAVPAPAPPPAALADAARPSALTGRADAAATPARATAGSIETPGLSNLRFEIKPRPQAWSWQRNDGPTRPMDDAMQNWIGLADRTARPHWNPGTAAGEDAGTTLRFLRDGQLKATLRIGPRGLRLDRGGTSESAGLAAAQTATLSTALDALGP